MGSVLSIGSIEYTEEDDENRGRTKRLHCSLDSYLNQINNVDSGQILTIGMP